MKPVNPYESASDIESEDYKRGFSDRGRQNFDRYYIMLWFGAITGIILGFSLATLIYKF